METWQIILLIIGGYLLAHLISYFIQDFFVFHTEKLSNNFKFKYNHPFEEVIIDGVNGEIIDGLFFPVRIPIKLFFTLKATRAV